MEPQKITAKRFGFAFVAFLLFNLPIAILFIMPWNLWIAATIRLGRMFEKGGVIKNLRSTELMVLSYFGYFLDGLTFISYILGILVGIGLYYQTEEILMLLAGIGGSYFAPVPISLIREIFIVLPFGKYMKLEEIAENTSAKTS